MRKFLTLTVLTAPLLCAAVPPSTGCAVSLGGPCAANTGGRDANYIITSDSTHQGFLKTPLSAFIATGLGNGWAADTGAAWISTEANQSNQSADSDSFFGTTTYKLTFNVTDLATAGLTVHIAADDGVTVVLGSSVLYTAKPAYTKAGSFNLDKTNGLAAGANTLTFVVDNSGGGPSGLNVSFTGSLGGAGGGGGGSTTFNGFTLSAPSKYAGSAAPDPVDSATGQFYDTIIDLKLGGPIQFGFARYYSSGLTGPGFMSSLGSNWMTNFDLSLHVSGSTAKAILFGGKVVTFTNTGGAWLVDPTTSPVYQLAQSGTLYKLMDPSSHLVYSFSAAGVLSAIADRNGNTVTVTQGPNGPVTATDGLGRTLAFTYTGASLTEVTDQAGRSVQFAYNANMLQSSTDYFNLATTYSYANAGSMTKKQLPLGNVPTTQTYDSSGRVTSQTDPNNHTLKIAYDASGGTTITDPLGSVTKHLSDSNGDNSLLTDPVGGNASSVYDATNRRMSVTDTLGHRTSFEWHSPTGYIASVSDAAGNTTSYAYTSQTQDVFTFYTLSSISYADGTSISLTYDANGNVLTETGRDGKAVQYTYDAGGRVLTITGTNKRTTSVTWNADSTLATITDALGNVTSYTYDNLKRVTGLIGPNGGKSGFVYDKSTTGPMMAFSLPGLFRGPSMTIRTGKCRIRSLQPEAFSMPTTPPPER